MSATRPVRPDEEYDEILTYTPTPSQQAPGVGDTAAEKRLYEQERLAAARANSEEARRQREADFAAYERWLASPAGQVAVERYQEPWVQEQQAAETQRVAEANALAEAEQRARIVDPELARPPTPVTAPLELSDEGNLYADMRTAEQREADLQAGVQRAEEAIESRIQMLRDRALEALGEAAEAKKRGDFVGTFLGYSGYTVGALAAGAAEGVTFFVRPKQIIGAITMPYYLATDESARNKLWTQISRDPGSFVLEGIGGVIGGYAVANLLRKVIQKLPEVYEGNQFKKITPLEPDYSSNPRISYIEKPVTEKFGITPSRGKWSGRQFVQDKMKMSTILDLAQPQILGDNLLQIPRLDPFSILGLISASPKYFISGKSEVTTISRLKDEFTSIEKPPMPQFKAPPFLEIRKTRELNEKKLIPPIFIIKPISIQEPIQRPIQQTESKATLRTNLRFGAETTQTVKRKNKLLFPEKTGGKKAKIGFKARVEYTPTASIEKLRKKMGLS